MRMKPKKAIQRKFACLYRRFTDLSRFTQANVEYVTENGKRFIYDFKALSFVPNTNTMAKSINVLNGQILGYKGIYYKYENGEWKQTKKNVIVETGRIPANLNPNQTWKFMETLVEKECYGVNLVIDNTYSVDTKAIITFTSKDEQTSEQVEFTLNAGVPTKSEDYIFNFDVGKIEVSIQNPTSENLRAYIYVNEYNLSATDTLPIQYNLSGKFQANKYYRVGYFDFMINGGVELSETQFLKGNITNLTSFNIITYSDIAIDHDDLVEIDGKLYSVSSPNISIKYMPKPFKIYTYTLNSIL